MAEFVALLALRGANANNLVVNRQIERKERVYHERPNPMDLSEEEFLAHYRLPKHVFVKLWELLRHDLDHQTRRGRPIDSASQVNTNLLLHYTI